MDIWILHLLLLFLVACCCLSHGRQGSIRWLAAWSGWPRAIWLISAHSDMSWVTLSVFFSFSFSVCLLKPVRCSLVSPKLDPFLKTPGRRLWPTSSSLSPLRPQSTQFLANSSLSFQRIFLLFPYTSKQLSPILNLLLLSSTLPPASPDQPISLFILWNKGDSHLSNCLFLRPSSFTSISPTSSLPWRSSRWEDE